MDGGNREEEDLRQDPSLAVASPSQSPYSPHRPSHFHADFPTQLSPSRQHQRQQQHARLPDQPIFALSADAGPSNDSFPVFLHDSSFDLLQTAHAADNFQAVAANATIPAPGGSPDDYYRTYQGLDTATHNLVSSPTHDPMASAISNTRPNPPSRSTSTSNGTASKPPAVSGNRTASRPLYRSASNPVDDRFTPNEGPRIRSATGSAVPGGAARASVKDMKKKFESSGSQSPAEAKRVASRGVAREGSTKMPNGRSATPQSYTTLRTTATNSPKGTATTQRSKFLPEDQVSSNSQSFASRINRPKATAPATTQNTRSAAPLNKQSSFPPSSSEGPLLFGEIRQEDLDAETPGFGIDEGHGRRPSESSATEAGWQHQRSQSDAVAEPASPTDWYRGAGSPEKNVPQNSTENASHSHGRSQSDLVGTKLPPINTNSQLRKRVEQSPSPHPSSSRLPVLTKKMGTTSTPASPASTRSNSPAGARRLAPSGRTSRQQSHATARARTPISRPKTPSGASAARRAPAQNSGSSRLAAVISPQPKLSPPLRSSRPRQPVSQASTASSRRKAVDRSRSPNKAAFRPSVRPESRQETPANRRRKLSLGGPVDFAQRRETIKLKYSKSIRETEAKQARDAAAEKRKKELEAAAKAKARAQARAEAQVAAAEAAAAAASQVRDLAKTSSVSPDGAQDVDQHDATVAEAAVDHSLVIDTRPTSSADRAHPPALVLDSPTLGLPGTFPSFSSPPLDQEQAPPSATSETSAVTEFDHEPQTEPPVPEQPAQLMSPEPPPKSASADTAAEDLATPQPDSTYERATYRDPFDEILEDESIPIKISLEPSSPAESLAQSMSNAEPSMPGTFRDDQDAVSECESQSYFEHRPEVHSEAEIENEGASEQELNPYATLRDEYEPQPYVAQPYHTTTVTIISRDAGFGSSPYLPQEGLEDAQPQTEPLMDSLEDFYTGPRLKDNIASLRDSTFTASDSGSGEAQHTPDTSNSLNVPSMTTPANRSSQHSAWTDLSYSSRDSRPLDYFGEPRGSVADDSRPQSMRDDDSSFRRRYFTDGTDNEPMPGHQHHHTVPDIDPRAAFSGPYAPGPDRVPHIPKLPEHSPPPPPEDESRPASGYYDDQRPDSSVTRDERGSISLPLSRAGSEDYPHQSSAPQSLDGGTPAQTPLEEDRRISEDNAEDSGPLKKEKNRLRQRQLVIKELVDTEAVFVRDMSVIEEIYKGTAEACPKLDDKTIKLIFRNSHEIIAFHTAFLSELKEGVTSVYVPRSRRSPVLKEDMAMSDATTIHSMASTVASAVPSTAPSSTTAVSLSGTTATNTDTDDAKDRQTIIGPAFIRNIEQMRIAHEGFLRTSDVANKRLIDIQQDPTVQVWLNECNEVAKDLTAAWNLDSLLIKPMQRITKYPNLISQLLQYTPEDHPDRERLVAARVSVEEAILEINKTKKNFELVGQIVGRKRKESDVKTGFARAFGKRVDKLQASSNRPADDPEYLKLKEKFTDDYLRLEVVLRDVVIYTREVSDYVQAFLDYLSAMELVMRLQPSPYPELESKWVQFNVSMRDIKKVTLEQHLSAIRKQVIEPFEHVIRSYQNPLLAMKKRNKRRLDYEKSVQVKKSGKKLDKQLAELVEHYEALNDTLKKELPKLSELTEKVGNICLGNMINIQTRWWFIWKDKVRQVAAATEIPEISDIVMTFQRDFRDMEEQVINLGILNTTLKPRTSQSTMDDNMSRIRSRPSDLGTPRLRGLSVASDQAPVLPAPDFRQVHSPLPTSPQPASSHGTGSHSNHFYRDYYSGIGSRGPASPATSEFSNTARSMPYAVGRPGTGRSIDSTAMPRPSTESAPVNHLRRESSVTNSPQLGTDGRRLSGLFQSALPLTENSDDLQRGRSSRASSRERHISKGYNILWLAASLFEFNIETTKHEAGYPYLTYQAGEIFDVIAEKGELWLAKNQDDPNDLVGWIWSKHFAKLADS